MQPEAEEGVVVEEAMVEAARSLPAVRSAEAMMASGEVTPEQVSAQRDKVVQVMELVMKDGTHYGKVPGVTKPTLLKPGAEVLAVAFRLAPYYESQRLFRDDGHLTVVSKVTLKHIPTGLIVAEGEGLCSSLESKYAWRKGERVCPRCGVPAIKKSRFAPKETDYPGASPNDPPGWYCFAKIDGCGANFKHDDPAILEQTTERVANPDLPDCWNTVLKMGNKRAFVAAILNGTAASDVFTQDVEDQPAAATTEKAQQWDGPKSWPEIGERLRAHLGEEEATVWVEQALRSIYGVGSARELVEEARISAGNRLAGVIHALDDRRAEAGDFPPPNRKEIQEAFGAAFDGVAPDGPPWRVDPSEEALPTHEKWKGLASNSEAEVEAPSHARDDGDEPVNAEGESIEF